MARTLTLCCCLFLVASLTARSQGIRDSKGKDFWLAVPPNDHASRDSVGAFLSILIDAEKATVATIVARSRRGQSTTRTVAIPTGSVEEVRLAAGPYELVGVNVPLGATNDCEVPNPASIHITTDQDVTVYAVLREANTSDAWLVLPTDAIGRSYIVSTYASNAVVDTTLFRTILSQVYPSQFVVVASEDGTDVSIDLSVPQTSTNARQRLTTRLNRGQSYLVQARVTQSQQNDDLTGTRISATRPIVVIGAHRRASVPLLWKSPSRDCLVEQLPSTDTWGRTIIVPALVPTFDVVYFNSSDIPQCRILASEDGTEVTLGGAGTITLDASEYVDVPLRTAMLIDASKPILVTIIDRCANRSTTGTLLSGDPSLIVVPPTEQFLRQYRVVCAEPRLSGIPLFVQHQITCIVPMAASGTLRIDGAPCPAPIRVGSTQFGTVDISTTAGIHELICDSAFGVIVYGYGPAESYGYTGGMAFSRLYTTSVRLRALDARGAPGERDTLHIVVDTISDVNQMLLSGASRLKAIVEFDATMFVSDSVGNTMNEIRRTQMAFTYSFDTLRVGDTVASVSGTIVLGMDTTSTIRVLRPLWEAGTDSVDIVTGLLDGKLHVDGVCTDSIPRLFDPYSKAKPEAVIYDVLGRIVTEPHWQLSPGIYLRR